MAVSLYLFPHAPEQAFNKEHDFTSDDYRLALLSTFTPLDSHAYWSAVSSNEIANGNGYTTNGKALTTPTLTYVEDSSATAWAVATAYVTGDVRRPTTANGHVYRCVVAGTSHASTEPTWSTVAGEVVNDNGVHWAESGRAFMWFDCDNVQWTSITFTTVRYGVIYNRTPATDATRPLLALVDFGTTEIVTAGTFTVSVSGLGLFRGFPSWPY